MMSDRDENPKRSSSRASVEETDKRDAPKGEDHDSLDPHRGTIDTPSQEKEMMPGGLDPEEYFDEDGALDEELEDLDDEEEE